jgi:hypothetical protein
MRSIWIPGSRCRQFPKDFIRVLRNFLSKYDCFVETRFRVRRNLIARRIQAVKALQRLHPVWFQS